MKDKKKGMTKDKKQLLLLGVLGLVLTGVLAIPHSGDLGGDGTSVNSTNTTATSDSSAGGARTQADGSTDGPAGNAALLNGDEKLKRSPFESFWSFTAPEETRVDDLPPPTISLNGTLTSGRTPVAVIDGRTRYLGDNIQGWTLEVIGTREISLRSPGDNTIVIRMPLLNGEGRRPPDGK